MLDDCYKDKINFTRRCCRFAYKSALIRKKNLSQQVDFYNFSLEILAEISYSIIQTC